MYFHSTPPTFSEQLLAEAATLAPIMTEQEFGIVSRIAAILLLGFLIPTSTGNDFFFNARRNRNAAEQTQSAGSRSSEMERSDMDIFISMPLEERLEQASRFYSEGEFGEVNNCGNPARERAFRSVLEDGIGPLLAARPAHCTETDLVHILAMAISPQLQDAFINETVKLLLEKDSYAWTRTKQLVHSIHPRSFQVKYSHRLLLVKLIANKLVLPQSNVGSLVVDDALQDGALPHLRVALHSFAVGGESSSAAHEARKALVSIAVQTGDETTVGEEWDALLKIIVNDCTEECECGDLGTKTREKKQPFCEHSARGKLMEQFVLNYNESRHYADAAFTHKALNSLSTCIRQSLEKSPCLLACLLATARSLFYFILPSTANDGDENGIERTTDSFIHSAIQLLHHPVVSVSKAASSVLALAFAYNPNELTMTYVKGIEKSIQMALDPKRNFADDHQAGLQDVIITLSRLVPSFASDMLDLMVKLRQKEQLKTGACRMIASVATARPFAAQKHVDSILLLAKTCKDDACKSQLLATLLTLRRAHLFANDVRVDVRMSIAALVSDISDDWIRYKLACHALITGNDHFAMDSFESLLVSSSSEASFLWLSALSNLAKGENELASKGCHGILTGTPPLYTTVSYLQSLVAISSDNKFGFQVEYLRLRIDFLEQCMSLYSICREIRLSGTVPKATVRTGLHLCNGLKLFYALAGRYYSLYKRYGLFLCQQSRTALRTCFAVCRWIGNAGRKAFPETKTGKVDDTLVWPHGDELSPATLLLKKLDKVLLDSMDAGLDPQVRAAAMAETLDAILKTPYPFPRGFTTIQSIQPTKLYLSMGRNELDDDSKEEMNDLSETIDVYPGATSTIVARGEIPPATLQRTKLPFSQVLLWHTNRYIGFLNTDDEALSEGGTAIEDSQRDPTREEELSGALATPLLPSGRFLAQMQYQAPIEEGIYSVDIKLGCRDVRCGEWELPVERKSLTVRVSRSSA